MRSGQPDPAKGEGMRKIIWWAGRLFNRNEKEFLLMLSRSTASQIAARWRYQRMPSIDDLTLT
jgi:hypothetical protein